MKDKIIQDYIKMISSYGSLIYREAENSWKGIKKTNNEPIVVRDYLLSKGKGVDYLNHTISQKILDETKYEIKFASVFCHKKPTIQRTLSSKSKCKGSTKGCELGDLMIVFLLLDNNKNVVHSTAKLMQAKKHDRLDSESQKCLYESDLDFEMPNNVVLKSTNTNKRRILPHFSALRHNALSYLIIRDRSVKTVQIPYSSSVQSMWGKELKDIMEFKTGLEFTIPIDKEDNGWNCIVNDLLNIGSGIIKSSTRRGYGLDHFKNIFNYFFILPEYISENENEGISTMIVFCKDTELSIDQ